MDNEPAAIERLLKAEVTKAQAEARVTELREMGALDVTLTGDTTCGLS